MTRLMMLLYAGLCAWACGVASTPAQAAGLNSYSYVSNTGNDNNPCTTPATACKSISAALSQTQDYGEIDCINADNYSAGNPVVISQSVTINCGRNGTIGSIYGAIAINGSGIVVILRNINFSNIGFGAYGLNVQNIAALYIENCTFTNYTSAPLAESAPPYLAIKYEPTENSQLFLINSIIDNNGWNVSGISGGLYILPSAGVTVNVTINHSKINGNMFGIVGDGRSGGIIKGTITDSVVSGSTENGITALSSGSSVVFMIDQTKVSRNLAAGLYVSGRNAGILARNSTVYGNAIGLDAASGGTLFTYGNNSVNGNTTNGAFTGTVGLQ